jgi:hypothetical protein
LYSWEMLLRRNRFLLAAVLSVLLCSSLILSVKSDASNWVQNYGGASFDFARAVIETSDGGYALAGVTESFGAGNYDGWLVKTDASGNVEWNVTYGGAGDDGVYSLVATSDGGYALAGVTESFGAWGMDGWLVKTDASGNMEWSRTYGGAGDDGVYSLVNASDGGYVLAGFTKSFGAGGMDGWLVKTDAAGNMDWNRTCGGAKNDIAYSLVNASDGGYALAGVFSCSEGVFYIAPPHIGFNWDGDFWLVKTDASGNVEWNMTYGGAGHDGAHSLVATSDGGYALAGATNGTYEWGDLHAGAFWLVKADASGNMEWNRTYIDYSQPFGEAHWGNEYAYSLVATSDGGYAIAGAWNYVNLWSTWSAPYHSGFWLVKTDAFGNAEWNQTYGGGAMDLAYSLIATSDGGYALAGVTTSFGVDGTDDFWLVKTDEDGVAPVEPEASWVILPFLLAATISIFISRKKLRSKQSLVR